MIAAGERRVNRCPSCQNLVPAGRIACRRCGAALPVARGGGPAPARGPGGTATILRLAPVRDTLLPGSGEVPPEAPRRVERDSLLPGPRPAAPIIRRHVDRRWVFVGAGVVVVAAAAWMLRPSSGPSPRARTAAQALLTRATGAAHTFYAQDKNYNRITQAALATRLRDAQAVSAGTGAEPGDISIWVNRHTLIVATAIDTKQCLFARTDPKTAAVQYATKGLPCAASVAPDKGWSS